MADNLIETNSNQNLFLAALPSGYGDRFLALLNAMYLSNKFGCLFGFVWKKRSVFSLANSESNVLSNFIEDEEFIFNFDFIKKYSYTHIYEHSWHKYPLDEFFFRNFVNKGEIIYVNHFDLSKNKFIQENFSDYCSSLPLLWNKINFNDEIESLKKEVDIVSKYLKEFIAITVRSGEIVYGFIRHRSEALFKAMPVEIAMEIILKNYYENIVLFGDDILELYQIKKFFKQKNNLFIAYDFFNTKLYSRERFQAFFDIFLMSKSKMIFSAESSFSKLSSLVGLGKNPIFYRDYFNENELFYIIKKNYDKILVSNLQKAYSKSVLFYLLCKNNINNKNMKADIIDDILKLDPSNSTFFMEKFIFLASFKDIIFAEKYFIEGIQNNSKNLKYIFENKLYFEKYKDFFCGKIENLEKVCSINMLSLFLAMLIHEKKYNEANIVYVQIQNLNNTLNQTIKEKDNIINSNINHINQLQSNIQEKSTQLNQIQSKLSFQTKYGTAKTRIQNQLSYKLGQAMVVNSKSLLGYLIMPIALLSIMISHKQEQKIYQEKIKKDSSLKLPPLESYPDYKEALKLKNHLSYRLGQALIKANKTWYKGGYVKILFEVGKLKRRKL
ncbi:hypothetical protein A0Y63_02570 [Campylobacter lari]|nr:hypothetical protein [Campylobacter lari]